MNGIPVFKPLKNLWVHNYGPTDVEFSTSSTQFCGAHGAHNYGPIKQSEDENTDIVVSVVQKVID